MIYMCPNCHQPDFLCRCDLTLACGHPDDDPAVWHHSDDHGGLVCSRCCPTCNKENET